MATYPDDAVGIFSTDGFSSMIDRRPDRGFSSSKSFNSIIFESDAGYEKRRLRTRRSVRDYTLTYGSVTGLEKSAIETFYNNRSGEWESFNFDLTHINETGNMNVRFSGPLSIKHIQSVGSNALQSFYDVSFKLQEVYD